MRDESKLGEELRMELIQSVNSEENLLICLRTKSNGKGVRNDRIENVLVDW